MSKQLILILILFCTACQSGVIPCPKVKPVRARKVSIFKSGAMSASVTATHEEEDKASTTQKKTRGSDQKVVSNVSVEEWDCPQPGKRKYMPRQVKANIRKNFEKINAARKEQADSLAAVQRRK